MRLLQISCANTEFQELNPKSRHCACVYYQDWHRTTRPRPAVEGGILPGVSQAVSPRKEDTQVEDGSTYGSPRNTLRSSTGIVIAVNEDVPRMPQTSQAAATTQQASSTSLSFDEEAKLVYGVVLSLRNMIKKLSGRSVFSTFALLTFPAYELFTNGQLLLHHVTVIYRDEQFTNYRTSTYKLHLYETLSGYKFVMMSDPNTDSLRFVMRQIYSGPFLEYVVRNPLSSMDSRERGVDNEYFRTSVDRMIRGLTVFQ